MSDSEIVLRAATLDDVAAIVAIERAAFSDPWSAASFRELMGRPEIVCEVAVVVDNGEGELASPGAPGSPYADPRPRRDDGARSGEGASSVIGFAIIYLADFEGDLANLATAESSRGRGIGRRLLQHMLVEARGRGARIIFLEVRESNVAARTLYESAGFVEVGRRSKYYVRPVEDALILRKDLA